MTITLSKNFEEKLSRLSEEKREAFISRAIEGELKMEHIFGDEVGESDLLTDARKLAQELEGRSRNENFGELVGLLDEFNS